MRNIKSIEILLVIILGLICTSCNSWFDFESKDWELEPQYLSSESISFGEGSEPRTIYIANNGEHSQISFSISSSEKWIVPATTFGTINKGEDKSVIVNINRTYLPEGNHTGVLSISTDDAQWEVSVSAIGINNIEGYPSHINFGSNDDIIAFNIRSMSGTRDVELVPSSDWISVSEKEFTLPEYDVNNQESDKSISVTCKRSLLAEGEHSCILKGMSGLGAELFSIPVSVTIPLQNALTVAIDNCVFSLTKHLYWDADNVILELTIKNHKYLRTFELIGANSFALADDNNKYSINNSSISIQPNAEDTMKVKIVNVDKNVRMFNNITLFIRDLSETIQFNNVELQK